MGANVMKEIQKPGGTVEKAYKWAVPYNIFMMDMIDQVTQPLRRQYSYLASEVKSPLTGLENNMQRCR